MGYCIPPYWIGYRNWKIKKNYSLMCCLHRRQASLCWMSLEESGISVGHVLNIVILSQCPFPDFPGQWPDNDKSEWPIIFRKMVKKLLEKYSVIHSLSVFPIHKFYLGVPLNYVNACLRIFGPILTMAGIHKSNLILSRLLLNPQTHPTEQPVFFHGLLLLK